MIWRSHDYCSYRGPQAREIFAVCRPDPSADPEPAPQFESLYSKLGKILQTEGGSPEHVVREFVFFRSIRQDMDVFLRIRDRMAGGSRRESCYHPASTFIGQPPVDFRLHAEAAFHAVIPVEGKDPVLVASPFASPCGCGECQEPSVRAASAGGGLQLHAGNICGSPGEPYAEVCSMYGHAENILRHHGMTFQDVVRTWIQLRRIHGDYAEFNRARRDFYGQADIARLPASTGIEGSLYAGDHNFLLSLHAIRSTPPLEVKVMTSSTLNEAPSYGADFSRGLKVEDGNKTTLWISGTASVDESGRTAHVGDVRRQLERTMRNISTLLSGQGASFRDLVSLTTYLKSPGDAGCLSGILAENNLSCLPNAVLRAAICRPDLLCEVEAVAVLPHPHSTPKGPVP